MPPKLCFKFQSTGKCRYGDSCKFAHSNGQTSTPKLANPREIFTSRANVINSIDSAPFSLETLHTQLTDKLASGALYSSHSDALVAFWPGRDRLEVLWKGFLMPQDPGSVWRVNSQTQALNFINSGLHALSKDNLAPQFVRELGKNEGRGVLIIQELLDLTYSNDAGRRRDVVSFQRGLVPFVTMLTMRRMEMVSQHMDEANYVYAYLRTAHVQLFRLYLEHLEQIVERHSIEDSVVTHTSFLCEAEGRKHAPLCFTQVCLPIIRLLYLLGNKFKDFIYEDAFRETVSYIDALTTEWIDASQENESSLDSALCFKVMREEIKRLHKMIRRGERGIEAGVAMRREAERRLTRGYEEPEPWDVIEVGIPGEAELADGTVGPRHDNDHRDICDIQLLPTTAECLSCEMPLLPGNYPFHENAHWLPPGPERWVDTHFRLYREDLCGTIRSCLQDLGYRLSESGGNLAAGRLRDADVDYNVYHIVKTAMPLRHTESRGERDRSRRFERHGLCVDVLFPQPSAGEMTGRTKTKKKTDTRSRKELWEKTGRLPFNGMVALVAYVDSTLQVVFCQIVERDLERLVKDVVEVTLQPFEFQDFATIEQWQHSTATRGNEQRIFLLEFNKVFLVAYEPVLRALQTLEPATLPFLEYLAPETAPVPGATRMESPMYCLTSGFTFDLSSVVRRYPGQTIGRPQSLRLNPLHQNSRELCEAALVRYSTLERDQAKALVEALSSRVACIQGLPGSGKSFIGSMLTQIIVEAQVSPVLVVCYTNHALDQFLCHLLDIGITSLVRIGGQCKEPRLEKYNLNNLPKTYQRYELKLLYGKLDENADAIALALRELSSQTRRPTWKTLKWFLETNYPDIYDYFADRNAELFEDGWEIAGYDDILDYWIQGEDLGISQRGPRQGGWTRDSNVWMWSLAKRRGALAQWVGVLRTGRVEELIAAQKAYWETMKKIETLRQQADVEVLKRVQIIGMTTTGVAKNQKKIAAVASPVVICEEAGEVLEAQLMACLSPSCQQLVLIGDHKQLRPHIADYNLSVESAAGKRFALDVSLFERLVGPTSGLPFWMLTEQHRMRPQISQLIRMLFYPEVRDARETLEYPPLLGVDKNVFFVSHSHPEDGASAVLGASARSHSNEYEVAYLVAALRYLLQQGYHTSDIAILTPYVGQLMKLRSALRGQFILELNELDLEEIQRTFDDDEDDDTEETGHDSSAALGATKKELSGAIRAATIDNFQGEEATVILASLVRSSTNVHGRGTIGFLKTPNRINVLLSRAKHGLILVGHGELLRAKSPLWQKVLDQLQSDGCYGKGLPLHCQQHPDYQRIAANPSSFALLAPDGGCLRPCGRRLPRCGHACPKLCHVDQPSHRAVYCTQPCPRLQEGCGHVCPGVCGDACGRCEVLVGSIALPCGHTYRNARCFEAKMPSKLKCKAPVDKLVPECGHLQRVTCSTTKVKCTHKCGAVLPCGHPCSRKCSDCVADTLKAREGEPEPDYPIKPTEHGACQKVCERLLPCCHRCRGICHGAALCPPCQGICDVFSCEHGSCNHPCSDPCAACTERCSWSCKHSGECSLPCGAPCNRRLCDLRCTKALTCGHQCPSVCGEDCPSREFCHICGDDDVKQRVADVILFQTYGEIDPSEDPVLVLPCCSMVYTMATLDGTLEMSTYYDSNGKPVGPLPRGYIDTPQCPNCKKPIRGLRRYGRVTKRAAIDAAEKNFITHSLRQIKSLQERANAVVETGDLTRDKTLRHDLRMFGAAVARPPCQKAFEACVALLTKARGGQGGGDVTIDLSMLPVPNSKFPYRGFFFHLSAQLSQLSTGVGKKESSRYARQAVDEFEKGSFSMQAGEARLVLVQILLANAQEELSTSVRTEKERKAREEVVTRVAREVHDVLINLEASAASFLTKYGEDVRHLRQKLVSVVQRARSSTFYQEVSVDEMRAIKTAMQAEFRGSGHWYRCENGHSYSIGECGMAMEETHCPECGARVGGQDHRLVQGSSHDSQMDRL
ncbi:AAA domain [Phytophthora infestans]|uniref:AAA domain n=1 Tax=Phytophthora infestans TaxID=4787 RepID=A0A8S9UKT9_PHYIN|nr:AAA domain [Phytophthora infestans]